MREPITISRSSINDNAQDFASLKAQGLRLAQQISGDVWSDYNAHDPGVTILEQLCYAITELTFYTDLDVPDLLSDESGEVNYDQLLLHRPEEVFPCRATTVDDLRKIILDEVKEIDNIWLLPLMDDSLPVGLYKAEVRCSQHSAIGDADLRAKVKEAFNRNRNLAEELVEVTLLQQRPCTLHASIEVQSSHSVDELLAEIYFRCGEYLAGNMPLRSYMDLHTEEYGFERLFEGPLTRHGLFELSQTSADDEVIIPALFSLINETAGVSHIKELYLELDGERFYESVARRQGDRVIAIDFPLDATQISVMLTRNGALLPITFDVVKKRYHELLYHRDAMRDVKQDFSALYTLPQAQMGGVGDYVSIQEQFPAIYGVNRYGVGGESPEVVARARQLKSYLLLFEQLMANFNAGCGQLDRLFSTDNHKRQSYGVQVLNDDVIADVSLLYPHNPAEAISAILAEYDDYYERKGRVLDYLLALYGQKFTQKTLRYFNYYYRDEELEEVIVSNKIACLESIIKFDRDRAAGFDHSQPSWNSGNISGLQRKLSILLGFRHIESRSLTQPLIKLGLKVVAHADYRSMNHGSHELKLIDLDDISEHLIEPFYPVAYHRCDEVTEVNRATDELEHYVPLKNNIISDALLQGGVEFERFRVGSLAPDNDYQIVFNANDEQGWWYVGRAEQRDIAAQRVTALHRLLVHLNVESEGLHLLEHLLLRPRGAEQHEALADVDQQSFYSARISVIFPAWSARCSDHRFRALAEESVRANCPAHIYADIYWFDFDAMYQFETLYREWLECCVMDSEANERLDEAAVAMIQFLWDQQQLSGQCE